MGNLPDSGMIARKLGRAGAGLCFTRLPDASVFARKPADLEQHD
jgi:hypothetical protein